MQKQFSQFNRFNPDSLNHLCTLCQYINARDWLAHMRDEALTKPDRESWNDLVIRLRLSGIRTGYEHMRQAYMRAV